MRIRVQFLTWLALELGVLSLVISCVPERQSGFTAGRPPNATSSPIQFAVISDLHFQPFSYPREMIKSLLMQEVTNWEAILKTNAVKAKMGEDSPLYLVKASLHNLHGNCQNPRFILCLGDFLGHDFKANCDACGVNAARFAVKTEQFVGLLFTEEFTNTPVFPVLGNNDSDVDDYVSPGQDFLQAFAATWAPKVALEDTVAGEEFKRQFVNHHGYYAVKLPGMAVRLLALNTDFLCREGQPRSPANEDVAELSWLRDQAAISTNNLWLAYHVPPGLDGHNFMQPDAEDTNMWEQHDESSFLGILKANPQIKMSFCGHTHRDEFRLVYAGDRPIHIIHIAPSISPCYFNNPAYQIYSASADGTIAQYETYYTFTQDAATDWKFEYRFPNGTLDTYADRIKSNFTNYYSAEANCDRPLVANFGKYWTNVIPIRCP